MSEIGRIVGVTTQAVKQWCEAGMPHTRDGRNVQVDSVECVKWLRERERVSAGEIDFQAEKARLTKAQADMAELQLQEERGELTRLTKVQAIWEDAVIRCRSKLLSAVGRAPQFVGLEKPKQAEELLTMIIDEALEELANGREI